MGTALTDITAAACRLLARGGARAIAKGFEKRDPFAAQSTILKELVAQGAATRFGKAAQGPLPALPAAGPDQDL